MTESALKAMLLDTSNDALALAPHPSTVALAPSRMLSAKSSALSITLHRTLLCAVSTPGIGTLQTFDQSLRPKQRVHLVASTCSMSRGALWGAQS